MPSTDELVFIHGPRLAGAGTAADRRRIRSELMRRLHVERQSQKQIAGSQVPSSVVYKYVKDWSICPECGAKDETGAGCRQCGMPIKDKKRSKGWKLEVTESKENRNELATFPLSRLGSGRIDPFSDMLNTGGMRSVDELIEHCIKKQMPSFRRISTWTERFYEAYMKGAWSPLLFHSSCLAISVHLDLTTRHQGLPTSQGRALEQLYHKGAALKALQKTLAKPLKFGSTDMDEIILCVCFLAIHDDVSSVQRGHNPFNPPFRGLQALDFYGCRKFNPCHLDALVQLVGQNGGFQNVKYYGAPWFLSYTSLKHAMVTSTKPMFPIADPTGKQYGDTPPLKILKIPVEPFHRTFNRGFYQLKALQVKDHIIKTLAHVGELAQCAQLCIPRGYEAETADLLGDARNTVQYRVLFLPKPSDPLNHIFDGTPPLPAIEIYNACWLATSIFTTHVTFPIPQTHSVREHFVPLLQDAISEADSLFNDKGNSEILLWCTMIGGIAAEDVRLAQRAWYAAQLRKLCVALDINDWAYMKGLMRSFAWLDSGCDDSGYRLWREAYALEDLSG
ncbi:conserved hypothetical protein [Paecilomyces variotii No. 5]|uniref:Uncharacterized protein n=1 Tax=Byssochlamys spectabilis (strain No. 5 / NBRC 109023) TaxID=1356009 RepID=V5GD32_BYSSN|nr:conserved hypothetical protein [Paecilomyces variotii No. 5]